MKNWNKIKTEKDFYEIVEKSHSRPQVIFKDSVSCGISAGAKHELKERSHLMTEKADFNYLDLLRFRSVSNLIAENLNVIHQSPQIIVLKGGAVIYKTSHHSIDSKVISEQL